MYLKSIEVHGFKSFANKLVFEFHNGITGIVGPNGSGKSNVADAVRWVLGEQSAKQLRGASMQDVIFAGTELRKPQSYAYVALTISNEDHKLNVPYEEVKVARRVYRSGESEYLINGAACRLKDIQELFFDTGIGKEGYSIIGQGQIDKILSGKPEERRELFDEAAGIVKYKKRKATAEKNLEVERQNLVRVNDILTELEKQVGPLEKQSEKAREYLRLKEELKKYEISLFIQDYDSFKEELTETGNNISNAEKELDALKQKQESTKEEYETVENQIREFDENIEFKKEKKNRDNVNLANLESEIRVTKEKIAALSQGKEFHEERMAAVNAEMEEARKEKKEYEENQKEWLTTLSTMEKQEAEKQEEMESLNAAIDRMNQTISSQNEILMSNMEIKSEIGREQEKVQSMMEQNSIRKAELNQRILSNKSQVSSAIEEMQKEQKALEEIREKLDAEYIKQKEYQKKSLETREFIKGIELQIQEQQKEFHMKTSELATLKNIAERYDGYGQSIRRVMEQKERNSGIVGVVADIIQVDKKYETAVETALGGSIQNIVTEDESTAKEMIQFLKKNRFGRATFLPLTTVSASGGRIKEEVLSEPGVIGRVSELVEKESKFEGLIEYLLGRFVLADTIDHAMALGRKYKHSLRIVTLEGELLSPGGSMSGGAYKNNSKLLGRRREMEKLEEAIDKLKQTMTKSRDKIEKLQEEVAKAEKKAADISVTRKELELQENTAKIKYEQAVSIKEKQETEYNSIINDGKELENQKQELAETLAQIDEKLGSSEEQNEQAKKLVESATQNLEQNQQALEKLQSELSELKLEIASCTQKNTFASENLLRIDARIKELEEEYATHTNNQTDSDEQEEKMKKQIEEFEKRMVLCRKEIEDLEKEVEEASAEKERLMVSRKDFFERRNAMMEQIGNLDKECFRLQSRKEKLEEQLDSRVNYMWSEYEITYHNAKENAEDTGLTYTRMKSQVSDTKNQIRSLGDVNVNAIEDYKSVSERYEVLKTQHDDLIESEEKLTKIIAELDEEMRKQFSEKFQEIKSQFDKVFRELFGGGKGTLELVEDEDVLTAGIRIIAQPPGKKLQNMMQLSGGEKALTAIALLFAIQNLKPSPFCLLDEIEAALDDSNVKRYAKYLHKLTKNTQFIVITHRQGTMSAADALYGITMQEKGVSTLVSVKLIEEQLKNENKKGELA